MVALYSGSAMADGPTCPSLPAADIATLKSIVKTRQVDRGLLWEVSKNGRLAYLYGTVHIAKLSWNFSGPVVSQALEKSEILAVELDTSTPAHLERMQAAIVAASPPETQDETQLSARLDQQFIAACVRTDKFAGLPAWYKVLNLSALSARDQGLFPDFGIDNVFVAIMRATGKQVVALETFQEQAHALVNYTTGHLAEDLASLESGKDRQALIQLTRAWESGDLSTLQHSVTAEKGRLKYLLDDRNPSLAQRIDDLYTNHEGVFVAIGVLHMVGEGSVIEQLSAMGYSVRQLVPAGNP